MKFTLRDLFWLTAVIGVSIGWYLDHHRGEGRKYTVPIVVRDMKGDLVEVSIGSDDGLAVGSMMQVYRDNTYVGQLTIKTTKFDSAVGQMEYGLWRSKIQKGDKLKVRYDIELRLPLSRLRMD